MFAIVSPCRKCYNETGEKHECRLTCEKLKAFLDSLEHHTKGELHAFARTETMAEHHIAVTPMLDIYMQEHG